MFTLPLGHAVLILALATATLSVDIRIERTWIINGEAESFMAAICRNVQPGECCKPPFRYPEATTKVLFRHLLAWDIAAVWRNNEYLDASNTGCSILLASRKGPGSWLWAQPPAPVLTRSRPAEGASYIRVPWILPPDQKKSDYLALQGVLGLSWSSGSWFASPAVEKAFGHRYDIKVGGNRRRDIRSTEVGNAYARSPLRDRYPDVVELNGTEYSAGGAGGQIYSGDGGHVLNLTDWFLNA